MEKIYKNLFVGNELDCFYADKEEWAVVHACKHPCHQNGVGYSGNLNPKHPNYLIFERENHLFLNMVDMVKPLSHKFTEPIISTAFEFIEKHIDSKNVLIHCNKGQSRAPSMALIFLSKREGAISNETYQTAREEFNKIYPNYLPGKGIETYLETYWNKLN